MIAPKLVVIERLINKYFKDKAGSILPIFAVVMIPVMTAAGAAIDYSVADTVRSSMQAALDAGILAGGKDGSTNWTQTASDVFNANLEKRLRSGITFVSSFSRKEGLIFEGSASAAVPTAFLGIIHVPSLNVSVKTAAVSSEPDNSCILTLDHGQPASHVSLTLNGAPIINLSGCSIRSNTALDCNGHDGNVTKAIAAGVADGCGKPNSYSPAVPDIYAGLASKITPQCGASRPGATWAAGVLPAGPAIKTVLNEGRLEYRICGDLTLTGDGFLTGSAPSSDAMIVVENGSLNISDNASISIARTAVILTGDNSFPSTVNFPTGNGKAAKLSLAPPLDADNPWQGVALYQDPKLTKSVDNKWGPGADFNADGLVYLGNSNVVTDGNTASSNAKCSKFVMNSFTTNGKVSLNFDQSIASCAAIGLKQWGGVVVHLIK